MAMICDEFQRPVTPHLGDMVISILPTNMNDKEISKAFLTPIKSTVAPNKSMLRVIPPVRIATIKPASTSFKPIKSLKKIANKLSTPK